MAAEQETGRGFFIGLRKDQLGARLLMMLNAIRLSEDYNADFRINWFPRGAAAPKLDTPTDLFDSDFIDRHFIDNREFEALDSVTKPLWAFLKDKTPDKLEAHLASGGHVLLDEGFEIVKFAWEQGEDLQDRFRGFISRIEFNPVVAKHIQGVEEAMAKNAGGRTIAYHIRRGDILNEDPWKHKEWPAKIEPDELYSAYLKKNGPAGALVFSDQAESISRFTAEHPQVSSIDDLLDLSDCKPVQRDFIEMFAMSRATEIVAPPISAFSRAAARLSGRERKCFHEVMSEEEREVAYQGVLERFRKGPGEFITPSEAAHIFVKLARRLQESDRDEEAWAIGQSILDAGADNAFLPLLHATTGMYLSKWDEALHYIEKAMDDPNQWQENFVSGLAIKAHILGALGRRRRARQSFLRAFWQKPMLPDITVIGTFMIKRRRLRPGAVLPFDRDTLLVLPLRYQHHNILVQQGKILKRRASNLATIAIEWPWFAMDNKTTRLLSTPRELETIQAQLTEHHQGVPGAGPFSFCALLEARMGRPEKALEMNSLALREAPDDPMVRKRQAEFLMMTGNFHAALAEMQGLQKSAPDHAFWHFMTGLIHEKMGDTDAAIASFETACTVDESTAELHAYLSDLYRNAGKMEAAIEALERARKIAPNQQRYENRRNRLEKKSA